MGPLKIEVKIILREHKDQTGFGVIRSYNRTLDIESTAKASKVYESIDRILSDLEEGDGDEG